MSVLTLITLLCLCGQSKVEGSVGIFEMNACDMDIILFIHHIDGNKAVCVHIVLSRTKLTLLLAHR